MWNRYGGLGFYLCVAVLENFVTWFIFLSDESLEYFIEQNVKTFLNVSGFFIAIDTCAYIRDTFYKYAKMLLLENL